MWKILVRLSLLLLLAANSSACHQRNGSEAFAVEPKEETRAKSQKEQVLERGKLNCGIDGETPGFSAKNALGQYAGFDVDICRAVAAAMLDNPEQVEYFPLNSSERFSAVAAGDVDLLSRTTTVTLERDAAFEVDFPALVLYDGLGIMVHKSSGIKNLKQLHQKAICFHVGGTAELNVVDELEKQGIRFYPKKFVDKENSFRAYKDGRCHAIARDRGQLYTKRLSLESQKEHLILDLVLSKEPLGPAIAEDDRSWFQIIRWIVYALIEAEELGITSENLEEMKASKKPKIKRFLGTEGDLGDSLGLPNDFTQRIIRHVGNYGEIYARHLGNSSPFKIPRGMNGLWTQGGLHYAPPFR